MRRIERSPHDQWKKHYFTFNTVLFDDGGDGDDDDDTDRSIRTHRTSFYRTTLTSQSSSHHDHLTPKTSHENHSTRNKTRNCLLSKILLVFNHIFNNNRSMQIQYEYLIEPRIILQTGCDEPSSPANIIET
ncbi:unnamed protein product [Rotaria socialis]|uniref:Uncharacterized protein n=1 Tax=Rotaria socialis TaxID=392032 RepID=A0A820I0V2_9BILA|nr:unnamed protein product [Rotaria socialis]CAF4335777.1 unnamed protein product [Rotaria socialis]